MKFTRCAAVFMALLVLAVLLGSASQAVQTQTPGATTRAPAQTPPMDERVRPEGNIRPGGRDNSERSRRMTDFKENLEALQDKWEALSPKDKASVYKLLAAKGKTEIALMNLYAKLGLISQDEAQAFSERVNSWLKAAQDEGGLPPIFGHPKRLRPEKPPEANT